MDGTQLSKITCTITHRNGTTTCTSRAFTSVTPPPSPREKDYTADTEHHDGDSRPPYSYVRLVIMALLDCEDNQGTIKEIYEQITRKFPYYHDNRLHWKNSVRHNLTVFSCFQRIAGAGGDSGRGSFLWKLTGDWKAILMKAEALQERRRNSSRSSPSDERHRRNKSKSDKPKLSSRKEKENAKRRRRDRARRLKLKSAAKVQRQQHRSPLSEFRPLSFQTPEKVDSTVLPTRMPTPPPKLPGIDNVFLPSPASSITPQKQYTDIWASSPESYITSTDSLFALFDDEHLLDYPVTSFAGDDFWTVIETDVDRLPDRPPIWSQDTPDPSPAKLSTSSSWCTSPTSSTTEINFWDLKEPEVDRLMELLSVDPEWMSLTEEDFMIGL